MAGRGWNIVIAVVVGLAGVAAVAMIDGANRGRMAVEVRAFAWDVGSVDGRVVPEGVVCGCVVMAGELPPNVMHTHLSWDSGAISRVLNAHNLPIE